MTTVLVNQTAIPTKPLVGDTTFFTMEHDKQMYTIDENGWVALISKHKLANQRDIAITANSNTIVTRLLPVAKNTLQAGSGVKFVIDGVFTGTATATIVKVNFGTLGTVFDSCIANFALTSAVGTSLARIEGEVTFNTNGAAAVTSGTLKVTQHEAAEVGIIENDFGMAIVEGTQTDLVDTTADNFIHVSITTAILGTTGTVTESIIERI